MNTFINMDWFKIIKDIYSAISSWSARFTVLTVSVFLVLVLFFTVTVQKAMAQSADVVWDEPVNLSRSGGTTNPHMVIDSSGKIHVIWEDRFEGYFYSFHNIDEWSSPVNVNLPFESADPQLIGAQDGIIHAFWIDEDDRLQHSYVAADMFDDEEAWKVLETVGAAAVNFAAILDDNNNLHVAYVRPLQTTSSPAGIYYKNSLDGGITWSSVENLYSSSYLRGITSESSHVSISSSTSLTGTNIFVSWDNRSRRQVFVAQSSDGGENWTEPREIDRPGDEFGASRPFNIKVNAQSENVLLIWQNGIPEISCSQYYVWSNDGGETWSDRLVIAPHITGCPEDTNLIPLHDNLILLIVNLQGQIYHRAWNGFVWSEQFLQTKISQFEDPETYEQISVDCRQDVYHAILERLLVIGCDAAGGGDVWFTGRGTGGVSNWFGLPPAWNKPEVVSGSDSRIHFPVLATGEDEKLHAMWVQSTSEAFGKSSSSLIYYSRMDGERWTNPVVVLASPNENPGSPSIVHDGEGRLLAAWSDNVSGNIYFRWAGAAQAHSPSAWIPAVSLPTPRNAARSPFILDGVDGAIYVAYSIPLNEERGIYITWSEDRGENWSQPSRIFDAQEAVWEMADNPRLTLLPDGSLHAVFTRYSLPGGIGPMGLYYARSQDGGVTWTNTEMVSEGSVLWSNLVSSRDGGLHRVWVANESGRSQLFHQFSSDGGINWSQYYALSNFAGMIGPAQISVDAAGRLHLFQTVGDMAGSVKLSHWYWDGDNWLPEESIQIALNAGLAINELYSAITRTGLVSVIFTSVSNSESLEEYSGNLSYLYRLIDVPEIHSDPLLSTPIPTSNTPEPIQTDSPTPTPTPTVDLLFIQDETSLEMENPSTNNGFFGLIIGGSLATILVGLVFVLGLRKFKGK
jgi:hypothetical protein